jgi:hypothetical protein
MQSSRIPWLDPRRMRRLTIAAMCAAGVVSTVGFSGSTPPAAPGAHAGAPAHRSAAR